MICKKCKKERGKNFRTRTKNGYSWVQGTCRVCEKEERSRDYHTRLKNDSEYMRNNRQRVKDERLNNPDLYRERAQLKRSKPAYKKYMRKYIKKNRAKVSADHKKFAKKWAKYNCERLTDRYVKTRLGFNSNDYVPQELIEAKRMQLKLLRKATNELRSSIHQTEK